MDFKKYQKINTIFKRDAKNVIMPFDAWSSRELSVLKDLKFDTTEKIDGTNIHLDLHSDGSHAWCGKTENAVIPKGLLDIFASKYADLPSKAKELFSDALSNGKTVCIYGEGFGGNIQKVGKFYGDFDFIVFDIKVDDIWLETEAVMEITSKLGVNYVPYLGKMTIDEAIEFVSNGFESNVSCEKLQAEGVVLRAPLGLLDRKGERIITKIKYTDFLKYEANYGKLSSHTAENHPQQPINEHY